MIKKAIITGATGFVGSNLCKKLLGNNWDVSIISRPTSNYSSLGHLVNNIDIFEDNGDIESLINYFDDQNAEVVFHLAAMFLSSHNPDQINALVDSNIRFGLHILEAMKFTSTKILINTGTSWQHYNSDNYNPVNLYAATKEAFEKILKYYIEAEKLRVITLKLFDTYGDSDERGKIISLLNQYSGKEEALNMSPGYQVLDFVHVDDVTNAYVRAYEYLMENPNVKEMEFGVGSGRAVTLRKLVQLIEQTTNQKINVNWGERKYRKREVMNIWKNYNKLPNWECQISLEEGLKLFK